MNKVELSKQLQSMGISPNKYSLEGSVATWDTIVLVKNYNIWKVLYIDERGNQNELASFKMMHASLFIMSLNEKRGKLF